MNRYEHMYREFQKDQTRKRVAAYCRVSTDREDQVNSFESQQRYFRSLIKENTDWELYDIFADEGLSGTSTKKRTAFQQMIACAKNGKIDLIVTKEISRFARNTLDSIYYTRVLKKLGVGVIFMNDGIHTLEADAELRLSILASIAQEESRKTSERVKWGQKRRMEQGIVFGHSMLGYDVKNGAITVNEDGAHIVRKIFHKFVSEGKGTHVIARELLSEGIKPMRAQTWSNTVILRILRNEKYCGDLVQKKTFTPDFLSHEKKYNRGQEEFVILKNHHEPIISPELFAQANRILDERAHSQKQLAKHSSRYTFSGKIKCGRCGRSYVARYKRRADGSQYKAWVCYNAQHNGRAREGHTNGCTFESFRNEDAIHLTSLVIRSLRLSETKLKEHLLSTIKTALAGGACRLVVLRDTLAACLRKRDKLTDLYLSDRLEKEEFLSLRHKYDEEIRLLREQIDSPKDKPLIPQIETAILQLLNGMEKEDVFYREMLDKVVVHDRFHIDIYIKHLPEKWSFALNG